MSSIRQGLKWNALGQIIGQISTIVGSVILARFLMPEDYGTVAMVTVISSFAYLFLDAGFTSALIQKKGVDQDQLSTVFWLYILVSLLMTFALLIGAPYISAFYGNPMLREICYAVSPLFLIGAFPQIPKVLLTRSMNFKALSLSKVFGIPTSYFIGVHMAISGWGLWSIVAQILIAPLFETLFILFTKKWKPKFVFKFKSLTEISKFSFSLFTYGLMEYWSKNIDGLFLGKFFGAETMGIFNRAFVFVLLPVRNMSQIINNTVFPKYSQLQENLPEFRNLFLQINRFQGFIVVPSMIGLYLIAEPLVMTLLGDSWTGAVLPIKIFAFVGILSTIQSLMDTSIYSLGYPNKLMKVGFVEKTVMVAGTIVGLRYGLMGVVWARLITTVLITLSKSWLFISISQISIRRLLHQFGNIVLSSTLMAIIVESFLYFFHYLPNHSQLILSIALGVFSYFSAVALLKEPMLTKLIRMLK